jgi:hypothetical protein
MDPEQLVILYSKYSPQCTRIVDLHHKHNVDYMRLLCIDNVNIREKLLQSTDLNIRTVPCVLFLYPGGRIEKFEGSNVSSWVIKEMTKNTGAPHTSLVDEEEDDEEEPERPPKREKRREPQEKPAQPGPQPITPIESILFDSAQPVVAKTKSISDLASDIAAGREALNRDTQRPGPPLP